MATRPLVRNPIIPLPLSEANKAKPDEILSDRKRLYIKNEDGTVSPLTGSGSISDGDEQHIELTKEQYDALPESEKNDPNKIYFIIDEDVNDESYENVIVSLNKEQYDELSEAEKHNGAIYLVKNAMYDGDEITNVIVGISQREYDALSDEEKDSDIIFFIYDGEVPEDSELARAVTQAEYDALPQDQKTNGTLYVIIDRDIWSENIDIAQDQTLVVSKDGVTKLGHYGKNAEVTNTTGGTTGTALVIGNGTEAKESNAFKVSYNGQVEAAGTFVTTGADYAEYFEWDSSEDPNKDKTGRFVTMDGEKIKLATSEFDYVLGVVSVKPSILGNSELADKPNCVPVGMLGVLEVFDDGTCVVNEFCVPNYEGIATHCSESYGYRVISRTAKNKIKIVFR